MGPAKVPRSEDNDSPFLEARVLALSVVAIRTAQGKPNPSDVPVGTEQWAAVVADFAADLKRMPSEVLAHFHQKRATLPDSDRIGPAAGGNMRKLKDTKAFHLSVAAIRTAQGKGNPENFAAGSTEWQSAQLGVMQDTLRILDLLRIEERRSQRRGIGTAGDIPSEG